MFTSQLLIILLLFLINIRVLILHHIKRDSWVMLVPLSLILSLLLILAWGINLLNMIIVLLAFLTLICNIRALFRYSEKLFIDIYSPLMKIASIILSIFAIIIFIYAITIRPVNIKTKKSGVTITTQRYEGNSRIGFTKQKAFSKTNADVYEIAPEENKSTSHVAVLIPDCCGDVNSYIPYMYELAKNGITVLSANLYTNDITWFEDYRNNKMFRKFYLIDEYFNQPENYKKNHKVYVYNKIAETKALVNIAKEKYGKDCTIFLIGDGISGEAVKQFTENNLDNVIDYYSINQIPDYKSSGFGFVEQTNIFIAKKLNLIRDKDSLIPKNISLKTVPVINRAFLTRRK